MAPRATGASSEPYVAGAGDVDVHQRVEQSHPLAPELELPGLARARPASRRASSSSRSSAAIRSSMSSATRAVRPSSTRASGL